MELKVNMMATRKRKNLENANVMLRRLRQAAASTARGTGCGIVLSGLCVGYGDAQTAIAPPVRPAMTSSAQPATKVVAGEPETQQYSATYGNWIVRCQSATVEQQKSRSCEMVQTFVANGQSAPFAQVAIGRLSPNDKLFITLVVPVNVSLTSAPRISVDEKDAFAIDAPWTRCLPSGCFASVALSDEQIKRWRALNQTGRVVIKNAAGQDVVLPLSFLGFAQAIDGYNKEK